MASSIASLALLVREYDEAISFFRDALGFALIEDRPVGGGKRWVRMAPAKSSGASLVLARAVTPEQLGHVGNQGAPTPSSKWRLNPQMPGGTIIGTRSPWSPPVAPDNPGHGAAPEYDLVFCAGTAVWSGVCRVLRQRSSLPVRKGHA